MTCEGSPNANRSVRLDTKCVPEPIKVNSANGLTVSRLSLLLLLLLLLSLSSSSLLFWVSVPNNPTCKFFFQTFTIPNFGPARPVLPPWICISPDCRKKVPRSIPVAATIQHRRHFRPYVAKPAEKPGALPSNPI